MKMDRKTNLRRLLAIILCFVMCIGLIPKSLADGDNIDETTEANAEIDDETIYNDYDSLLGEDPFLEGVPENDNPDDSLPVSSPDFGNFATGTYGGNGKTRDQIIQQIKDTYSRAKKKAGCSSFSGFCAWYVNWTLALLGINSSYVEGNGNREFDNYCNKTQTNAGCPITAYPASNYSLSSALNTITHNGTVDAYNILVGFEKGSSSPDGQKYGHTCFIHAIIGGQVLFSESFAARVDNVSYAEGAPIECSISTFCAWYNAWTTQLDGVIYFGDALTPSDPYVDINVTSPPQGVLDYGKGYVLSGNITSNSNLTLVRATIQDASGKVVGNHYYKVENLGRTSYNIKTDGIDANIKFGDLAVGNYKFVIDARNSDGKTESYTSSFAIGEQIVRWYQFDVNGWLDGGDCGDLSNYGLFDITIDGEKKTNQNDALGYYPEGTTYKIESIRATGIHAYLGVYQGTIEGTINEDKNIKLNFRTNANLQADDGFPEKFYAFITTQDGNFRLFNNNRNVQAKAPEYSVDSVWEISAAGDNYYNIYSIINRECFDVTDFGTTPGTNLQTHSNNNNDAQLFSFHRIGDAFEIKPKCTTCVVDCGSGDGAVKNAYMQEEFRNQFQLFKIEQIQVYNVHFDANGGAGVPSDQEKLHGFPMNLPSEVPSRTGYTFLGWSKSSTATSATYSAGGWIEDEGNTTLYAVWKANTYGFSFDANGGSGNVNGFTVAYGENFTLPTNTFTKTGYSSGGWYLKRNEDNKWYVDGKGWFTESEMAANGYTKGIFGENRQHAVSGGWIEGYDGSCTYTLYAVWNSVSVTDILLNKASITLTAGGSETLTATVEPSNATNKNVTWTSSDTSVATVSNGTITAVGAGTAIITATTADGDKTASCSVTVEPANVAATGITLNYGLITIEKGTVETLVATISPNNATNQNVIWISSDTSVATVSNGDVTAVSEGSAYITATTADGGKQANCLVRVCPILTGISLSESLLYLNPGSSIRLSANPIPENAFLGNITWTSSNPDVIKINEEDEEEFIPVGPGIATITATTKNGTITASCTVIVEIYVDEVRLNENYLILDEGQSETLVATIYPDNATNKSVIWTSSDTSVATVSNGIVKAVGAGTAIITATAEDNGTKASCLVSVDGQVINATSVTLNKTSMSLTLGSSETLSATVEPSNATNKNVTWASSDTSVATVSNGTVTAVGAGIATITVTAVDGNKTAECKVTVIDNTPSTYTLAYNANGGANAPASQIKTNGEALTLSSTVPTRDGYTFLGWAESASAMSAQYQPGASFTKDDDTTLYAVWEKIETEPEIGENDPQLVIEGDIARAGDTVTATFVLKNVESLKSIALSDITFDDTVLELVGGEWMFTDSILQNWNNGNKTGVIAFADNTDVNGAFFKLTFMVKDGAPDGDYTLNGKITAKAKLTSGGEANVEIPTVAGKITVISFIKGDVDGDDEVTSDDAIHLLYYTLLPELYPVNQPVDFDGDGQITSDDAIYLLYYTLLPDLYPLS